MSAPVVVKAAFRVVLTAPSPQAGLAAGVLAGAAGIDRRLAGQRLAGAPSVLCEGLAGAAARRLAVLLRLFGLRVRTEAESFPEAEADEPRFDVAVQAEGQVAGLPGLLGLTGAETAAALRGAGGMVLGGLDWSEVTALRQALDGRRGLRLLVSDPDSATYDLFPRGRAAPAEALVAQARRLGHGPCAVTGALAAGLDRAARDHLMRRFPGSGAVAVNRDFQRFDLLLSAPAEAARFVAMRRDAERALPRAEALLFRSDYAAIGVEARLLPVWLRQR
jgi:hypothetical protein